MLNNFDYYNGWKKDYNQCDWNKDNNECDWKKDQQECGWKKDDHECDWKKNHHECDWKKDDHECDWKKDQQECGWKKEHHECDWNKDHHECGWKKEHHECDWKKDHHECDWKEDHHKSDWKKYQHEQDMKKGHHSCDNKKDHHVKKGNFPRLCAKFADILESETLPAPRGVCVVTRMRKIDAKIKGRPTRSPLALNALFSFECPDKQGRTLNLGETVILQEEINPFITALKYLGIKVTALHNHWLFENPRLFYIHFLSVDDPITFAKKVAKAFEVLENC